MTRIKRIIISTMVALGIMAPALVPAAAHAVDTGFLSCGAELEFPDPTTQAAECTADTTGTNLNDIITTVINIISIVVGIVAVIMIIIGGFRYITSNGDSGAVSAAKNTILYAIVGLVIVALAQIIVRFVIGQLDTATGSGGAGGGGGGDLLPGEGVGTDAGVVP